MRPGTLPRLFADRRPADPSTVFLEVPGGQVITYADLDARSAQVANALVSSGVRPGDRVAVQAEKSPEVLLVYLATVRSGADATRPPACSRSRGR